MAPVRRSHRPARRRSALRGAVLALLVAAPVIAAGCGSGPTPQPSVARPALDPTSQPTALAGGGVIDLPATWKITTPADGGPLIALATSGQGFIAVWRYARTEPLPVTRADLRNTRRSLRNAVLARDPQFKLYAAILRPGPPPAVEIIGTGRLAGAPRAIRSLHVYSAGSETVVDCVAPVSEAAQFASTICDPALQSLQVS